MKGVGRGVWPLPWIGRCRSHPADNQRNGVQRFCRTNRSTRPSVEPCSDQSPGLQRNQTGSAASRTTTGRLQPSLGAHLETCEKPMSKQPGIPFFETGCPVFSCVLIQPCRRNRRYPTRTMNAPAATLVQGVMATSGSCSPSPPSMAYHPTKPAANTVPTAANAT